MGKRNGNGYGKGTFIETRMFLSKAFINLGKRGSSNSASSYSIPMLLMFLGKRKFAEIKQKGQKKQVRADDNRFYLTYKELASHGISQPAATRAIDELLAKGFVLIAEHGGAFNKHKTVFSLADDWMNWKPGDPPVRIRQKDVKRGFQGKGLGAVEKIISTHANVAQGHTR